MSIRQTLQLAYDTLESCGYTVYGVFLYGSQNYGTATRSSDVDCKAVIIPNFTDLVIRKKLSFTFRLRNGDKELGECDVKDIRDFVTNLKKQSMNYVECLFTEYYILNPVFAEDHAEILGFSEDIARLDERKAIDGLKGNMLQAFHKMTNDTETTHEDIEKYGYHLKSLSNVMRLSASIVKYVNNAPYRNVMRRQRFGDYKKTPVDNFRQVAAEGYTEAMEWYYSFKPRPKDELTIAKLDRFTTEVIWKVVGEEVESWKSPNS